MKRYLWEKLPVYVPIWLVVFLLAPIGDITIIGWLWKGPIAIAFAALWDYFMAIRDYKIK